MAIQGLFGGNDTCSNIARRLITSGRNISDDDMPNIACLSRLLEFGDSCNMNFVSMNCNYILLGIFCYLPVLSYKSGLNPIITADSMLYLSAVVSINFSFKLA